MPVSASGLIATRSSMAMRTSSAQSMSSGLLVTRPSANAASASSGWPMRGAHGVQRGLLVVEAALPGGSGR
jgi:hypothetical protein